MRETYLVRNAERALALRKASAASRSGTLGLDITTPSALLSERWDVFGDDRRLVTPMERLLLMADALRACERSASSCLSPSMGTVRLLADLVARYAGVPAFDEWVRAGKDAGLPASERSVLAVLRLYAERLDEHARIECGSAAARLASGEVPAFSAVSAERLFVAPAIAEWLRSLGVEGSCLDESVAPLEDLAEGAHPRFVFTTGETVVFATLLSEIESALAGAVAAGDDPRVVVLCPDPAEAFETLAPVLSSRGVRAALRTRVPFSRTCFGRALRALRSAVDADSDWRSTLTDFAYDPASGIAPVDAERFNTRIRSDSLMSRTEGIEELLGEAGGALLRACASAPFDIGDAAALLDGTDADGLTSGARDALDELLGCARAFGVPELASDCLEGLFVPLSCEMQAAAGDGTSHPSVEFRDMESLDACEEAGAFAVIVADVTRDAFAIPKARPATDAIVERLGIVDARMPYERKRRAFGTALRAARGLFVTIAPLRRASGAATFPSFLFEELVSSLSEGSLVEVDDEGLYKVPARLRDDCVLIDETDVVAGFGRAFGEPEAVIELPVPVRGRLEGMRMADCMRFAPLQEGQDAPSPILSPSQLEAYSHCPYLWFVSRKVRIEGIDEALDAAHLGSFAHKVFEDALAELARRGISAVTSETLGEARMVAGRVFDELARIQPTLEPLERCAIASEEDAETMGELRAGILEAFGFMALLPSGFSVVSTEKPIDPAEGIGYAGAMLDGCIDRVDARADGPFVVLDYKGSAAGHEAGCDALPLVDLPESIQALVYAQALRRMPAFGYEACAGALYLSYHARQADAFAAGSVDLAAYDARPIMGAPKKSAVSVPFGDFLDAVEGLVAPLVEDMVAGRIAPRPRPGACRWCPYGFCAERRAD